VEKTFTTIYCSCCSSSVSIFHCPNSWCIFRDKEVQGEQLKHFSLLSLWISPRAWDCSFIPRFLCISSCTSQLQMYLLGFGL